MNKEYWEHRYQNDQTGWDAGSITLPLKNYIDQIENKELKILIPGCGFGHEFDYLLQNGFKNVFVIDIAFEPLHQLRKKNPDVSENHFIHDDFFNFDEQFDLILEQTFFCAISPQLRVEYVKKMHTLLKPNGKVVGLLFDFPLTNEGPPFGGSQFEYEKLFSDLFNLKTFEKSYNSILPRKNKEFFFIAIKK